RPRREPNRIIPRAAGQVADSGKREPPHPTHVWSGDRPRVRHIGPDEGDGRPGPGHASQVLERVDAAGGLRLEAYRHGPGGPKVLESVAPATTVDPSGDLPGRGQPEVVVPGTPDQ